MGVNIMGGRGLLGIGDFGGILGGACGGGCGGGCGGWDWGRRKGCGCDNDRKGCFVTAVRAGCFKGDGDWEGFW